MAGLAPGTVGTEIAVKLAQLVSRESAASFFELVNAHRSMPVRHWRTFTDGSAGRGPEYQECGANGCGQPWPCATRQALDVIEALANKVEA